MFRHVARTVGIAGLLLSLAACGSASQGPDGGSSAQADPDATINAGFTLEPTGLDMTTTSGAALRQLELGNVYEGLVSRTHDNKLEPLLAKEWKISEDKLTYTFTLVDNVTFSSGTKMTADDVVASLSRACGEACGSPKQTASTRMTSVSSITSPDPKTVVITLSTPDWRLLDTLSTDVGVVTSKTDSVDMSKQTNGTGPYSVSNWQQGSSITLSRRDDYWGTKPKNKQVVFHYYKDPSAAANALSSGEIDFHTSANPETIDRFSKDDNFVISEGSETSWMTLGFNNKDPKLADVRIRRAIRMAIDKAGLVQVLGIAAQQVGSMSVPGDPWYTDLTSVDPYNPEQAKALLKDAGAENLNLTLEVSNTYDSKISEYIAAQLKQVGVNVTVQPMEFATWLDKVYQKKDYQLTMVLHVDPWTLTYYGNPNYYWNYNNPDAQKLLKDSMSAVDTETGYAKLKELSQLVAKDAASDWLYAPKTVVIASTSIAGEPTNRINSEFHVWNITKSAE